MALRGPASVTVHDDGDVGRQSIEVYLAGQGELGTTGSDPGD
jgi:hypothetical protein